MKRIFVFTILLWVSYVYGQSLITTIRVDFDGAVPFSSTPAGAWGPDSTYFVPSSVSSGNTPKSYLGMVPNRVGDTAILLTPEYDFPNACRIQFNFSHICKVSPLDSTRIQYRESGTSIWKDIPSWLYNGNASNYSFAGGFNANSYPEWQGSDSIVLPSNSWWREESFDLSSELKGGRFEFRFIIIHGQTQGTQVSYGWLLDNVEFIVYEPMGGSYSVGNNNADYASVQEAIEKIKFCTPVSDVTLNLQSGIYNENWDFTGFENVMGNYTLKITSLRNNKDSVILQAGSGIAATVSFNKTNNVVLENITIKAAEAHAIQFVDACANIVVNNCNILEDTMKQSSAPLIYKSSSVVVSNIQITNNVIDGGGFGVYFLGSSSARSISFILENNIIQNSINFGLYIQYMDLIDVSYNTILSKTGNTNAPWRGISVENVNGPIIGNRIIQRNDFIVQVHGLFLSGYHINNQNKGNVVNNEIIISGNTLGGAYGMYIDNSKALIAHNSVYVHSEGIPTIQGINIDGSNSDMTVHNNNIMLESQNGYPINLSGTPSQWDINTNNYYAPQYIGFDGATPISVSDWTGWQTSVPTDSNSVRVAPDFVDSTSSLRMNDYTGLECYYLRDFNYDINKVYRSSLTSMGCYNGIAPLSGDIDVTQIVLDSASVLGIAKSVSLEIFNAGTATITNASFVWKFNNGTVDTAVFQGSLAAGQYDTLPLGQITYIEGDNNIIAYLVNSNLNNSVLTDQYPENDTASTSIYGCRLYNGRQIIGDIDNGADFASIEDFFARASVCGIDGDIELAYQDGEYTVTNIAVGNYMSIMNGYKLTITSLNGDPDLVKLKSSSTAFTLANVQNFVIDAVTIDVINGIHGILFTDACTNIVINNCNVLGDTIKLSSAPLINNGSTGMFSNIRITNNVINGGDLGIYFSGGSSSTAYGVNFVFENNIIRNSNVYGLYVQYMDSVSVAYNTILSKTVRTNNPWSGVFVNYINGQIIGNRIIQRRDSILQVYGLHLSNYHINTRDKGNVVNNEIIISGNGPGGAYGMYIDNTKALIAHNSVYVRGKGGLIHGINIQDTNSPLTVRNNNIMMTDSNSYPIYLAGRDYLSQWDINSNNYYAPQYIGFDGVASISISDWTGWKTSIPTDSNLVQVAPDFVDSTNSLRMNDYTGLECYSLSGFNYDIDKAYRPFLTTMGCYNGINSDIKVTQILDFKTGRINPDTTKSVLLEIFNAGISTITNASFAWKFNNGSVDTATFQGTLASGEYDTIPLGQITYTQGENNITAYLVNSNLNNGALTDQYSKDDTASAAIKSCYSFVGRQIIGDIDNGADFTSIEDFFARASVCGIDGDIELAYQDGEYTVTNLTVGNYMPVMNGHKLTITSLNDDPTLVKFKSSGVAFTLANVRNFVIDAVTIDVTNGMHGIQFTDACTNVVISNCEIYADSATSSFSSAISKYTTGILDSITIINNIMDGGYYGIYLVAGTGAAAYGRNIRIDSNIISNTYQYGLNLLYTDFTSISNNTISSRTVNATTGWYGLYLDYANGLLINGNIVRQLSAAITSPSGFRLTNMNIANFTYPAFPDTLLVSNNAIYVTQGLFSPFYSALYVVNSRANIINNTFCGFSNANTQGFCAYFGVDNNPYYLRVKNNIFVQISSAGYPICIDGVFPAQWDFDANLLYSGGSYVGYAGGGNIATISEWQSFVSTDIRSVSFFPKFKNIPNDFLLRDTVGMGIPAHFLVSTDLLGLPRSSFSNMGACAYHPYSLDAELLIVNTSHMPSDVPSIPSVVLVNTGEDTVTSATIEFSFNGLQASQPIIWTVPVPPQGQITIPLSDVTPMYGTNDIKVWLTDINGQGLDMDQKNDTIRQSFSACTHVFYNNSYVIGTSPSADFQTLESVFDKMRECGMKGNVTLLFESDTYQTNIIFPSLVQNLVIPDGSTLTITSLTGNADDVIIKPISGEGIVFSDNRNITVKNITIDVSTSGGSAIVFNGACSNLEIYGCNILNDPLPMSETILSSSYTTYLKNIRIIKNMINGGVYGIHFNLLNYPANMADSYGNIIDSNTIINPYVMGIFISVNVASISHNTIQSPANASYNFQGIHVDNNIICSEIVGNKINITYDPVSTIADHSVYGIYTDYVNYSVTNQCLVANNEIRIIGTMGTLGATTAYHGIYAGSNNRLNIYNNSIFIKNGYQPCYGINKYASDPRSGYIVNISHNNIAVSSLNNASYPLYTANSDYLQPAWGVNEYNNYYNYNGPYIVFADVPCVTIADVRNISLQDVNSRSYNPFFMDSTLNLNLSMKGFANLLCPVHPVIKTDITGKLRDTITVIGAYELVSSSNPAVDINFVNFEQEVINESNPNVEVSLKNLSSQEVTHATIEWTVNGTPQTAVPYTASIPSLSTRNVILGSYPVSQPVNEVKAWLSNVNASSNALNDTAVAISTVVPLAEYVNPFVKDTINKLSFTVTARIRPQTGASLTPPKMIINTIVHNQDIFIDTVDMDSIGDEKWIANIPPQYYGSKVIYSLAVEDTLGNYITLIDSTYITFNEINDTVTIGDGIRSDCVLPLINVSAYSWSRQIYTAEEINPYRFGGVIKGIAWKSKNINYTYSNQTCYLKAVNYDSYTVTGYMDPITVNAQQVWQGRMVVTPEGWVEIELDSSFVLPPNMNLEVHWHNMHGAYPGLAYTWYMTPTLKTTAIHASSGSFPSTLPGTLTVNRPDVRFVVGSLLDTYAGYNLTLTKVVEPINDALCYPSDYTKVKVVVTNLGSEDYDFALSPLKLSMDVTGQIPFTADTIIETGMLAAGEKDTVLITSLMPAMFPGRYDLKLWLTNAMDIIPYDDTLTYTYISGKLSLPVDEQFINDDWELSFNDKTIVGNNEWEVIMGASPQDTTIFPAENGDGMLSFTGIRGDLTRLSTRQLDLYGTANPSIQFWYFHDTIPAEAQDYMDVLVTFDGGNTYAEVMKLIKYNPERGWKHYTIPLSDYITESCVIIAFESMIKSAIGAHYLDRILITSEQDLELSTLSLSGYSACDLGHNELTLKRRTTTSQKIDFSRDSSSIQVDITDITTGLPVHSFTYPLTDVLMGDTSDVITLARDIALLPGTYTIIAYLTSPVDEYNVNDTVRTTIIIKPEFSIEIEKLSGSNPATAEFKNQQKVTITNTGNMELSDIGLILTITSDDGSYIFNVKDTFSQNLQPNGTATFTFDSAYIVPWNLNYTVAVHGYLLCDSALVNRTASILEEVNITDLYIVDIISPSKDSIDTTGSLVEASISVRNRDLGSVYDAGVKIWLLITDTTGQEQQKIEEELPSISGIAPVPYTFTGKYTVPALPKYHLTVYIENKDSYAYNDTIRMVRQTKSGGVSIVNPKGASFTMEQNIPNPAKGSTIINYSIPQDGEILFQLYSISGQLLYTKQESVPLGDHQIELNLSNYASGIYFYTMEYEGQRISKRMSVTR